MSGHLRQRSPGSWEIRYPAPRGMDGKRKTATATFRGTKRQAEARLRELMGAVDRGQHVDPSKITVAELVRERIEVWRAAGDITAKTREAYLTSAGLIGTHLGVIGAQRLTTRDVEQWHLAMRSRGLASSTIRKAHAILVRALAEGKRHKVVQQNVAQEQGLPKLLPAAKVKVLKDNQVEPLLAALDGGEFHAPAALTIYAGLRRGEMLALRWSDINLDAATLTISRALEEVGMTITFKSPKTAAGERTVSLPAKAVEALRGHLRRQLEQRLALGLGRPSADALVFPDPLTGAPRSPRAFTKRWSRVSRRVADGVRWHSLRHLHCSLLVLRGVDLATVAARLGHSQIDVTIRTYTHQVTPDDRHAAEALDRALG